MEGFLEICRDGTTAEWTVKDGRVVRADLPDMACTPPNVSDQPPDAVRLTVSVHWNNHLIVSLYEIDVVDHSRTLEG